MYQTGTEYTEFIPTRANVAMEKLAGSNWICIIANFSCVEISEKNQGRGVGMEKELKRINDCVQRLTLAHRSRIKTSVGHGWTLATLGVFKSSSTICLEFMNILRFNICKPVAYLSSVLWSIPVKLNHRDAEGKGRNPEAERVELNVHLIFRHKSFVLANERFEDRELNKKRW
ncbi:hypothetical protein M438DRAFT_408844 [Aureobasidium pullulans EXF-150]|uniref:Uncharacterized protein n=1 Tax=Aureobasidium pullulans EXF-150 TaxID=1043002 RepID=A0A074X4B7_AURPU|nr:uncharacterized protein M438DRAFT_408844 [Aureobasidium pullulans EXF-150]KEQ80223.1 hypothetical protein M438DRAFT_408844 [Aureobasidium pullulans EXF-150]